jgi:hypothetical protein
MGDLLLGVVNCELKDVAIAMLPSSKYQGLGHPTTTNHIYIKDYLTHLRWVRLRQLISNGLLYNLFTTILGKTCIAGDMVKGLAGRANSDR